MELLSRALKNANLQLAIMASFNLAVIFELLNWTEPQVAAVDLTLGLWILLARQIFEKDLSELALAEGSGE